MTNKLVETAGRIAPQLGETAGEDNALRRLSDRSWKILMDNGFLRSLQPARWGGGETSLMEFVDATIELARVSPSAAWIAGVIGLHPWQLALFDERAQQEMWGKDPATMHSSSYNPTGKAEKVAGGFKLSGRRLAFCRRVDVALGSFERNYKEACRDALDNPMGQVPTLVGGEIALHDSTVIFEYLEERYPKPARKCISVRADEVLRSDSGRCST